MSGKKHPSGKPQSRPPKPRAAASAAVKPAVAPQLSDASRDKRLMWFLALIAFCVFANTLTHGFVLDDLAVIEKNAFVQQGFAGIPKIFGSFYWEGFWKSNAGLYRPLSLVMFAIEWGISPNNPFLHHFVNVMLYAVTAGALFRLLRRMFPNATVWVPFCIALLFVVHPIHTEVVANIKSRDELLCFLFFVLTFRYVLKNGLRTLRSGLIAGALFFLCLLSKEAGILFLPVMGLYFLLFRGENVLRTTRIFVPLIVTGALWLALHQYIIRTSPYERITYTYLDNSLLACPDAASQTATGIAIFGRYVAQSVAPLQMSYDYSYSEIPCERLASPIVLLTLLLVAAAAFCAWRCRKTRPEITFGLLFFAITIALVTNVFTLIGATMADRLLYAPVLGTCIVVVYGVYALLRQVQAPTYRHAPFYGFVAIGIVFAVASFRRNRDWESNTTLFTADVENAPNSARVHANKGALLLAALPEDPEMQQPYLPEVVASFQRALQIDPQDQTANVNLGVCYFRLKDYRKSVHYTRKALSKTPNDVALKANLADALFKDSLYDSAVFYYRQVIASPSATAANYNFMGVARFNQQRYLDAAAIFQAGLKKFPDDKEMLLNLGSAYGSANKLPESRRAFERLVAIDPQNYKAMQFLGMTCDRMGDLEAAAKWHGKLVEAGVIGN